MIDDRPIDVGLPQSPPIPIRPVAGYCAAVLAASTLCWAGLFLATAWPLRPDRLLVFATMFVPGTVIIALGALLPFLLARWFARRLDIRSWFYEMACGGIVGLILGPLVLVSLPDIATTGVPSLPFRAAWLSALERAGPFFLLGGSVGGLTYWLVARQRRGLSRPALDRSPRLR